ncbi:hypothetical protein [Lederbergia citri]|uniref:Uncharacterized protein n=1 Tax=Lederbergia citri TaxID=2833580 RepID=A0A942TDQ4_9BACI|nr:hypothetical protein [Lederbergia citri]MBS4195775.1 hypothetical protein [Lederbergia citri]
MCKKGRDLLDMTRIFEVHPNDQPNFELSGYKDVDPLRHTLFLHIYGAYP